MACFFVCFLSLIVYSSTFSDIWRPFFGFFAKNQRKQAEKAWLRLVKSGFFRQSHRSLGQFAPEKNSYFSAVSVRFFRRGFTTCAEPPRAPHLPALQNSPFADLLAFVLSAIECFFLHHHCLVLRLTQSTGGKSPCPGAPFSDRVSEKSRA